MFAVGAVEIVAGLALFVPRSGGHLVAARLPGINVNLVSIGGTPCPDLRPRLGFGP